ncbi:MAG: carbohydrate kinase family protein [Candidatus Lokiarchaeota archaeon]|nr:carbohydrate kinase family protein [Candidatus Lokiarchaeota archaeon]
MTKIFDVICIGAALVDIVAQVERHPEEDDEVFVADLELLSGGAAANTAYACAELELKTAFIGKIGRKDTFGTKIINDFNKVDVNTDFLRYSDDYNTGSAYIALNKEGDRRIYAHSGAANYLSKEDINEDEIASSSILFLSSLKNLEPFVKAAEIGKKKNIPVVLNPGMLIIEQGLTNIRRLLEKIDILIISQREFKALFYLTGNELNLDIAREKAKNLFSLGIDVLVITLGKIGAYLATSNFSELVPSYKIDKVVDTTGAGDAFSAGFLYGFIQHPSFKFEDLRNNVMIGNFIAGKCIEKLGARNGIPGVREIEIV